MTNQLIYLFTSFCLCLTWERPIKSSAISSKSNNNMAIELTITNKGLFCMESIKPTVPLWVAGAKGVA